LLVPLPIAHQIQALLAEHGYEMTDEWHSTVPIKCLRPFKVEPVEVHDADEIIDATMLTDKQFTDWKAAIKDRTDDTFMRPEDFKTWEEA
jgi:hypothetical protein